VLVLFYLESLCLLLECSTCAQAGIHSRATCHGMLHEVP